MTTFSRFLLAWSLIAAATAAWGADAALVFDERHASFGDRYQGAVVEARFGFTNAGQVAVTVRDTFVVDGTGEVSVTPRTLEPGERGTATVRQPLAGQLGRASFRYALITDEPDVDRYRFTLSGFVQSAFDPEALTLDFGRVERENGGAIEVELGSREVPRLELGPAGTLPLGIGIEVLGPAGPASQGLRLRATLPRGAAPGLASGQFTLPTNVVHQPQVLVLYRVEVLGDVVPGENPLNLGITRIGERLHKEVRLESRSGRAIEVEDVDDGAELFEWSVAECPGADAACRRLVLELDAETPLSLVGRIRVHLAGEADPLTLNYRGMVVSQDTVIRTLTAPEPPVRAP